MRLFSKPCDPIEDILCRYWRHRAAMLLSEMEYNTSLTEFEWLARVRMVAAIKRRLVELNPKWRSV